MTTLHCPTCKGTLFPAMIFPCCSFTVCEKCSKCLPFCLGCQKPGTASTAILHTMNNQEQFPIYAMQEYNQEQYQPNVYAMQVHNHLKNCAPYDFICHGLTTGWHRNTTDRRKRFWTHVIPDDPVYKGNTVYLVGENMISYIQKPTSLPTQVFVFAKRNGNMLIGIVAYLGSDEVTIESQTVPLSSLDTTQGLFNTLCDPTIPLQWCTQINCLSGFQCVKAHYRNSICSNSFLSHIINKAEKEHIIENSDCLLPLLIPDNNVLNPYEGLPPQISVDGKMILTASLIPTKCFDYMKEHPDAKLRLCCHHRRKGICPMEETCGFVHCA